MIWDWQLARIAIRQLLPGLWVTLELTGGGSVIAITLGLLLALSRYSSMTWITRAATIYLQFFRNTPLLVQLYLFFYALPAAGIRLSVTESAILILGLHTASYMAEVYRAGIESVPKAQWEACTALNFPRHVIWRNVVIPQAIPPVVPPLVNYVNEMFKLTAYASVIGGIELFGRALRLGQDTYQYLVPITIAGVFYLVLSSSLSAVVHWSESRRARLLT